jgi:hypothetical protein
MGSPPVDTHYTGKAGAASCQSVRDLSCLRKRLEPDVLFLQFDRQYRIDLAHAVLRPKEAQMADAFAGAAADEGDFGPVG